MSDGNRKDMFRFPLKKGQRVVIECQAQKLDSQMDATLTMTSADGKQLASNGDYNGRDPLIDVIAPAAGDYFVSVYDLSFRGGHPYRLIVSDLPHVENAFPRAVEVGKSSTITVMGRNFGKHAKTAYWKLGDLDLDASTQSVTPPADVLTFGAYRFIEHPTTHSVLPTAATASLTGFQFAAKFDNYTANPVPLLVVDTPVTLEVEPNDDPKNPQKLQLPAVVSGRFNKERDADWYEFETAGDGPYAFEVYSERIAGRADPYLVIVDDKDNRVSELDDFGPRINAFDGHLRDPSGVVNLSGKRSIACWCRIDIVAAARFQYVLTIRKPVPDFYAAVIHQQNPGPGGTTIRRGGATYLDVVLHLKEGFNGPITITAEGLPKGLHTLPTTITSDTRGTFVLWADNDAPEWTGPIKLWATGKVGDRVLKREVRPYTRVWNQANISSSRPMREMVMAIRESSPFDLRFSSERVEVQAGKKVELKVQLDRRWPDFKNTVNLIPLSFPGPFKMNTVVLAADKNEATVTIEVQANTRPGEYTLAVTGQAQVPYSKDAKATTKPNTLVSQPSHPITVVVLPAMKK